LLKTGITTEYVNRCGSSAGGSAVDHSGAAAIGAAAAAPRAVWSGLTPSAPGLRLRVEQRVAEGFDHPVELLDRQVVVEREPQETTAHVAGDRALRPPRREAGGAPRAVQGYVVERRLRAAGTPPPEHRGARGAVGEQHATPV